MNRKDLKKIADAFVDANLEGFKGVVPTVKEVSTDIEEYRKSLKTKKKSVKERIFSFTYVNSSAPFKKVFIITMTEDGKIIKTSKSG